MNYDANTAFARCLVDEWCRGGVTAAVLSPGSRSTPMALALADHDGITLHVHVDERSASFLALGLAKASGRPAVVLCTSGTAAANFHPAVLEASYARVPLLVCTADRPPELRDVGAAQTVDQANLYGTAVRWYFEPATPSDHDDGAQAWALWRSLAARALAEAMASPPGPVHLNLPFREPLVPPSPPAVPFDLGARPGGRPWLVAARSRHAVSQEIVAELVRRISGTPKGVLVAGWGASVTGGTLERVARAAHWPILADPISGLRAGPLAVSSYDALSRVAKLREALRPDLVVRVGAPLTSKSAMGWLASSATVTIDADQSWADPQRAAEIVLDAEPESLLAELARHVVSQDESWLSAWIAAEASARRVIDGQLDSCSKPFEGRVARDLMEHLPDDATLMVASSMPVRDLESFARPRSGVTVLANRGANGIDGFVSTVLGVAASQIHQATVALVGDLCLLHDSNGLLGAQRRGVNAVFVVVDNDGGGIFSFLPQAGLPTHFEELFATPHGLDIGALAALHGIPFADLQRADELGSVVRRAIAMGGIHIVRVPIDRSENVRHHERIYQAVAEELGE